MLSKRSRRAPTSANRGDQVVSSGDGGLKPPGDFQIGTVQDAGGARISCRALLSDPATSQGSGRRGFQEPDGKLQPTPKSARKTCRRHYGSGPSARRPTPACRNQQPNACPRRKAPVASKPVVLAPKTLDAGNQGRQRSPNRPLRGAAPPAGDEPVDDRVSAGRGTTECSYAGSRILGSVVPVLLAIMGVAVANLPVRVVPRRPLCLRRFWD